MSQMPVPSRRQMLALALGEALAAPAVGAPRVPLFIGTGAPSDRTPQMLAWMGAQAGLGWDYRPTPWLRAQKLTAAGEGVMFGLTRTPQRDRLLRFSLPIWTNFTWVIVRTAEKSGIRRYGDLNGQVVCWARGSSYGELFTRAGLGRMDARDASDDDGALRMLAAGRCRAALITLETDHVERAAQHPALAQMGQRGLALVPGITVRTPLHFATGIGSHWTWVIDRLNQAVSRAAPGELEKMRQG